jgi:hypothetical protein
MKLLATLAAAITATILIALFYTSAAQPAQITCDRGFAWGQECWTKNEGRAFATWLGTRGASPKLFRQRHPELAATFTQPWPPVKPAIDWERLERDFHKALRHAAGRFGVSFDWLHNCAHSEGGHGPAFVWGSSGDYGPFQYLAGTFEFMSRSAFQTRGHPPMKYRDRGSIVGQTWTTAWAFSQGLSYHWYGSGC